MLTPHIKDPERKNELARRTHQPETFGRTEIPRSCDTVVIGNEDASALAEQAQAVLKAAEIAKGELRKARNSVVAARELKAQAKANLKHEKDNNAEKKVLKPLVEAVTATATDLENAEQTLNDLIDA